ncbi:MAG: alpha-1,2-fucosyltransferase [Bacteroidota bacterium]
MITVRLKGGMGNQMFQYAFGRQLATQLSTDLQLDLTALLDRNRGKDFVYRNYDLDIFHVQPRFALNPEMLRSFYKIKSSLVTKFCRKLVERGHKVIKEPHFHVDQQLLDQPQNNALYDGWWQSGKYFEGVADTIRQEFQFKHPLLPASESLMQQIKGSNAVCLNVRRTDFLKVDNLNTTNKDYFIKAAKYISERVESPHFFIFSDDIAWCEGNLELDQPTTFVHHDVKGIKFGNYMRLMKACKHFIIPNSSFAWWAVWLNEYSDKIVIAPKNWFNDPQFDTSDLVPEDWVRM